MISDDVLAVGLIQPPVRGELLARRRAPPQRTARSAGSAGRPSRSPHPAGSRPPPASPGRRAVAPAARPERPLEVRAARQLACLGVPHHDQPVPVPHATIVRQIGCQPAARGGGAGRAGRQTGGRPVRPAARCGAAGALRLVRRRPCRPGPRLPRRRRDERSSGAWR